MRAILHMLPVIFLATGGAVFAQPSVQVPSVPEFSYPDGAPQCRGKAGYEADFGGRRTFVWRPAWLSALAGDTETVSAITKAARSALDHGPYSVTDKPKPIPGASANDYASIGPYWWPDPQKKDGLPYNRRDGEVNPERDGPAFDKDRLRNLRADVRALALGYFVTGDEAYATKAASLLRVWFLDPATRMNPNMNFAQGVPGKVNGRGEGIIEASDLSIIVESIGLLRPSGALTADDHRALESWYREFAVWLATSDNGADEMNKANNHGVFFDFYLAHFALYAGLDSVTAKLANGFPQDRLARQMDRQGRFIEELKRTRSWHYSHYVVEGAAKLATISECVGKDLWSAKLDDGRSLANAEGFLAKYWAGGESWPFPDTRLQSGADPGGASDSVARVQLMFAKSAPGTLEPGTLAWDNLP